MAPKKAGKAASKQITVICPEKTCLRRFKTERALTAHLDKSPACAQALTKMFYCQPIGNNRSSETKQENIEDTAVSMATESFSSEEMDINDDLSNSSNSSHNTNSTNPNSVDNTELGSPPTIVSTEEPEICFTVDLLYQIKLMDILEKANSPHYLFQDIVEWVVEAQDQNVTFSNICKSRESGIKTIERFMPWMKQTAPYQVRTILETNTNTPQYLDVTVFNFKNQLLNLLGDKSLFGDIENLDVNPDNPFGKYTSPNKVLSTVNSGKRYKKAYRSMITDPENQLLLPIIFATDETKVSSQGKASSWPLVFTTSILNQSSRNKPSAWRLLGYIHDSSINTSSNQERQFSKHLKSSRLHQILKSILGSFVNFQKQESGPVDVNLGRFKKQVILKTPCFFIIGDMQGGDKMACSSVSYSNRMHRLCRKCDVEGCNSGNPQIVCRKIKMKPVKDMVDQNRTEELDAMNQYHVQNAWFNVDFGGCPYGIFSAACPVEPLHALENGLMNDCIKVLLEKVGSAQKRAQLDHIAKKLTRYPRQRFMSFGSDKEMPRLLYQDGICDLVMTTAATKVGIMFTIVVIALQEEGSDFFSGIFGGSTRKLNDMRECFQMMLCYWMWLKKDSYWIRGHKEDLDKALHAIRTMLTRIVALWPRTQGQGWNLAKFHEQLHVPDDINQNGSPCGSHSGPLEHNHIQMVKKPSDRTQKRRKVLDWQLATRNYESNLITNALQYMNAESYDNEIVHPCDGPSENGSKGWLRIRNINGTKQALYTQPKKGILYIDEQCVKYIVDSYCQLEINESMDLFYFSEYRKDGQIYRAHTDYRQQGPWHDWVMVRWEAETGSFQPDEQVKLCHVNYLDEDISESDFEVTDEEEKDTGEPKKFLYCPGQILCFVSPEPGVYHAILKSCDYRFQKCSVFTTLWKQAYEIPNPRRNDKKPYIGFIDVDSIVRHVLMIPVDSSGETYQEIWNKTFWAAEFHCSQNEEQIEEEQ